MSQDMTENQIVTAIEKLPAQARKNILRKLLSGLDDFEQMVARHQPKVIAIARERGIDFTGLTEAEKEKFIDYFLHE